MQKLLAVLEALLQKGKVVLARLDESRRLVQLSKTAGGLHVSDLEVVPQMAVGVLVVVALGQVAEFPAEAFTAGVVSARRAEAVPPPVTKTLRNRLEFVAVGEDGTAFAHGDVVSRVEAQRRDVAEGAHHLAAVGAAQGVAAVLHQPELVFLAQVGHHVQIERVAQAVCQHDGFGLGADGGLDLAGVDVVRQAVHVDKYWDGAKLNDGVYCGREAGGHAYYLIALLDGTRTEIGRSQRAEGNKVS